MLKDRLKLYLQLTGRALSDQRPTQIAIEQELSRLRADIRARMPENFALRGAKI
jgi:hypothetical protein